MAAIEDASQEPAFAAFMAEFTRNGFDAPEGLINLLRRFVLKPGETPDEGRARLHRRLWSLLWFGSRQTLGAHVGKPTYVYPATLKGVIRHIIPGDLVNHPDPNHARVYRIDIADLASVRWLVQR